MAINAVRPDGASYFNEFTGDVVVANGAPTPSGEAPAGSVAPGTFLVKFGPLALDRKVFDDAGYPFGTPTSAGPGPHTNVDERTWAQNARVTVSAQDANCSLAVPDAQAWEIDATTGLPVLRMQLTIAQFPAAVDVQVEITQSAVR